MDNRDSATIANEIVVVENQYAEALKNLQLVEEEILYLQKDILEKQHQKKSLEINKSKASYNVRQLNIKLRLLRQSFWSIRESGL